MKRQVLLLSSSRPNRQAVYFSHARGAIENILKGVHRLLFIPYAAPGGATYSAYTGSIREAFSGVGLPQQVEGIEAYKDPVMAIREAEAVFIGGGNTFLLLKTLYDAELLTPLRQRVAEGMPYIGSSAGSNVAGLTINTSNDMAIVHPPSFDALGILPFNINPHYPLEESQLHSGESRAERIREFHSLPQNRQAVLALYERSMLHLEGHKMRLLGSTPAGQPAAWLFRQGEEEAVPYGVGGDLSGLLAETL
ncbi:MAG: dipeptidase PepE [Phaeodactylibacter sp.]|nr:dipeptidase PepE [Phaeodactylibacter sp.]